MAEPTRSTNPKTHKPQNPHPPPPNLLNSHSVITNNIIFFNQPLITLFLLYTNYNLTPQQEKKNYEILLYH